MFRNLQLTVEYDGTHFNGWQIQREGLRTIQGELERILKIIFSRPIPVIGCGRTDSGVHAQAHISNFRAETLLDTQTIQRAINAHLPEDIVISHVRDVPLSFHAQFDAIGKIYRYSICNRAYRPVLERTRVLYLPYKLNLPRMRRAAIYLTGRHDFRAFMACDPGRDKCKTAEDTRRTIKKVTIKRHQDTINIDIEGDGFLYKMVRNIVGTLVDIGRGRKKPSAIQKLISEKNRRFASPTAPAHGLCLQKVIYRQTAYNIH